MADREKELVEEVRRLRRERNRVRDEHDREARKRQRMKAQNKLADQAGEPRPFAPDDVAAQTRLVKTLSQRAEAVDAELEQAERKLERFRAHLTPKQRLAKKILESPNSRFVFSSPTGGTARAGFEAIAAGRKAPVAATGVPTNVQESLLRAVAAMADHGVILINCLTNAKHVANSNHYKGKAVDLDLSSPLVLSGDRSDRPPTRRTPQLQARPHPPRLPIGLGAPAASPFVGLLQVEAAQGLVRARVPRLGDSPLVRIDAVQLPATADSLLSPCVQARPESDVFSACGAR